MESGPGNSSCLEGIDGSENSQIERPAQAEILRNPRAVREAKLELLREVIFENLGAVSLFAETAKLSIEEDDDAFAPRLREFFEAPYILSVKALRACLS